MVQLNLTANGKSQEMILAYLQENASDVLAEKINKGVSVTKDGKRLINKKNLDGFMAFANGEARKLTEKGARDACIDDPTVYGWAIHYFEENTIEGKLYNEDGTEYKPPKPVPKSSTPTVSYTPPKPKPEPQLSMFDMLGDKKETPPQADDREPVEDEDEEPTEEELAEAMEEQERQVPIPPPAKQPNAFYQHYLNIQNKYSDAVVALRVGDFYEVFGNHAITIANELDMTLTGRDCGLQERVPMIGFPHHAAESYFVKLIERGYKLAIAEDIKSDSVTIKEPALRVDEETGEILSVDEMRQFDGDVEEPVVPTERTASEDDNDDSPEFDTKAFDLEALAVLDELFGSSMILR